MEEEFRKQEDDFDHLLKKILATHNQNIEYTLAVPKRHPFYVPHPYRTAIEGRVIN